MSEAAEFKTATGDGTFIYNESGEGPLVVLLHGFPDLPHGWFPTRDVLNAAGYRTVVPYLRGYGSTRFLSSETFRNGQQAAVAEVNRFDAGVGICGAEIAGDRRRVNRDQPRIRDDQSDHGPFIKEVAVEPFDRHFGEIGIGVRMIPRELGAVLLAS